jgi:hypothetical protein
MLICTHVLSALINCDPCEKEIASHGHKILCDPSYFQDILFMLLLT